MIDLIRNTSNIEESIVVVFSQGKQFYRYYFIFISNHSLFYCLFRNLCHYETINDFSNFTYFLYSITFIIVIIKFIV